MPRRPIEISCLMCAALLALGGCSSDNPPADTGGGGGADGGADSDGPKDRPYLLGARAEAYSMTGQQRWLMDFAGLQVEIPAPSVAEGVDAGAPETVTLAEVVVVPLDLLGIPWESFDVPGDNPDALPGAWVSAVNDAKSAAAATGMEVVLALSPLNRTFDNLNAAAVDGGGGDLVLEPQWHGVAYCYDPAKDPAPTKWRDAYAKYAVWAVKQFDPRWVVLGERLNLYEANCAEAGVSEQLYPSIVGYATAAHEAIAALSDPPTTIVSVDVEDLYGYPKKDKRCVQTPAKECFEQRKGLLDDIVADRLGLESHPAIALPDLGSLPGDWVAHIATGRPDLTPVITGAGLPGVRMEAQVGNGGPCGPLLESDEETQRAFLDQLLGAGTALDMDLVVWSTPVDRLEAAVTASCPCGGDADLCLHLDQLGVLAKTVRLRTSEGLWSVEGTTRLAGEIWRQLLESE